MKTNSQIKETRLLLNLYPVNSLRLSRIEARLKVEGKTRTWWINAAVREKLDRDHPETNCAESEYKPAPLTWDTPEAHTRYVQMIENASKILNMFAPAAPLKGSETPAEKWQTLNDLEKAAVVDAAEKLTEVAKDNTSEVSDPLEVALAAHQRQNRQQDTLKLLDRSIKESIREAREDIQANPEDKNALQALQKLQTVQEALDAPWDGKKRQIQLLAEYLIGVHDCGRENAFKFAAIAKGQEMTAEEGARIMAKHYAMGAFEASPPTEQVKPVDEFWGE